MSCTKKCAHCGKLVARNRNKYCSIECAGFDKRKYSTCVICGKPFQSRPRKRTCGKECSSVLHRQIAIDGGYLARIEAGEGWYGNDGRWLKKYYESLSPEDQPNAKHWVIQSPSGEVYDVINLLHFFRTHADLVDGTPEQAARGFVTLKAASKGLRKPVYSWKGWMLLRWDD